MKFLLSLIAIASLSFASPAAVDKKTNDKEFVDYNQYDKYFAFYAKQYGLNYFLLKSIAKTENFYFNPKLVNHNTNGTKDYGLMQINTIWMQKFGLKEHDLFSIETNIHVAAKILSMLINQYGYSWETIGRYHSNTPTKKKTYVNKIKENVELLAAVDPKVIIQK